MSEQTRPGVPSPVEDPSHARPSSGADRHTPQHVMWSAVAGAWAEHAEYVDRRGAALADWMLDACAPRPGERVLELACGAGGLGLAAARRVAPDGEVVLSDVAAEMTAIASARAAALGLANVTTRVIDLERIGEPTECYDVILCREGLMFATDPVRAARGMREVLRPGGRVAVAVWAARERNPWLGIVLDAVSAQTGAPVPPPGVPGPFSLGGSGLLERTLHAAGFADIAVTELAVPLHVASFEEWWARTTALAGPIAIMLRSKLAGQADAIRERARALAARYQTSDGLRFPGVALLASGRRPKPSASSGQESAFLHPSQSDSVRTHPAGLTTWS